MENKKIKKFYAWFGIFAVIMLTLILQSTKTACSHIKVAKYNKESWEIVWPAIVSALLAIFGTLVTSYVFLKDALDRTIDEKPYYKKVIERYRQERVRLLMYYSITFVGISCYLILFQRAVKGNKTYDGFLYFGIIMVVLLLLISLIFLYRCINIDESIYECADSVNINIVDKIYEMWKRWDRKGNWKIFIEVYAQQRDKGLKRFLEVEPYEADKDKDFNKNNFIIKFSEWEKFILSFLDKSAGFQNGQSVEERMSVAARYISKLTIVQEVEKRDTEIKDDLRSCVCIEIQRYAELLEKNKVGIEEILIIYQLLSDYRDTLQVKKEKKFSIEGSILHKLKAKVRQIVYIVGKNLRFIEKEGCDDEDRNTYILYAFFMLKFYISINSLARIPKIEIFYPSAKMDDADFYNVRFENTSFRASLFRKTLFARIHMVESNMAFSRFEGCNFYNSDIRGTSISNSSFRNCLLAEMILLHVDATGAEFMDVDLSETTFDDTLVINVEFHNSVFSHTSFINCKLAQVNFTDVVSKEMVRSSFENSTMKKINFESNGNNMKIPQCFQDCDRNYFQDLEIERKDNGRKSREESDIWNNIRKKENFGLDMSSASFVNTVAEKLVFHDMCLNASIFSNAVMQESKWENVCMRGCVMDGTNLTEAIFIHTDVESCMMAGSILYKGSFCLVNLQNSNLCGCHASGSKWTCCAFDKSDVSHIDLTKSRIKYSSFRDTIMTEAELTYAEFEDVLFDNLNGRAILSSYSRFEDCSFLNAYLASSNFNYTVFERCNLELANIMGSTVEEAVFERCDFKNANFRECCFIKVEFRNNDNFSQEIFENSTFIDCKFVGNDTLWGRIFQNNPEHFNVI